MNSLLCRRSATSFGNIRRHRYSSSAYLVAKAIFLCIRKTVKMFVYLTNKDTSLLPNIKLFKYKLLHNISFAQRYNDSSHFHTLNSLFLVKGKSRPS